MRVGILFLAILCALAFPAPGMAKGRELPRTAPVAAKVGKLDGAEGPTLEAVGTPVVNETVLEKTADSTLARELEKAKEWALAALEWQRVAKDSLGKGRLKAMERAARSYENAAEKQGAARLWRNLAAESEGKQRIYALYRLSQLVEGDEQRELIGNLKAFGGPWGEAVLYRAVWKQAHSGPVTETYSLQKALELQRRLAGADEAFRHRAALAAAFGVVPGMGHAYLGNTVSAAAMLTLWSLLGWLFLWCWKRRWWPFVALWMLPFGILWGTSPGMAGTLADAQNTKLRQQLLTGWDDLKPVDPIEE